MNKQIESDIGISEYDLAAYLCKEFEIALKSETEYIQHYKNFGITHIDGNIEVEGRETQPYKDGFDTDDGEFLFLDEFETQQSGNEDEFYLITPKSPASLNSQFKRSEVVYLHPSLGYKDGMMIDISSESGSVTLKVQNSADLREDSVMIYSGTKGVNNLTSSKHSYEGKNAIFQENRVRITS